VKAARVDVVTVKAGDMDLSSATGRMVAGILGSVARGESERMGKRVSRAKQQRAAQGRPAGGGLRPFGYEADRITLHPIEAPALAEAAARVAAGGTYNEEAQRLNDAGLRTSGGRHWTIGSLRRAATSPRVAGLRAYKGEIVGPAVWPAIVDPDTWEQLRTEAASRRRGGRGGRFDRTQGGVDRANPDITRLGGGRMAGGRTNHPPNRAVRVDSRMLWFDQPQHQRRLSLHLPGWGGRRAAIIGYALLRFTRQQQLQPPRRPQRSMMSLYRNDQQEV
jgi:hypothetical protein